MDSDKAKVMEIIKELIKKPIDSLRTKLPIEIEDIITKRLLEYELEEFERNYYTKTILHRVEPIKLHDFYLPLHIRRYGKNYKDERIETNSCEELFAKAQFITLIGTGGSGKSTIVKYLLVNSIENNFKVPIKIELRYLNNFPGNIVKYLEDEVFKIDSLGLEKRHISQLLNTGKFLFFFDGYDEVGSSIKDTVTKDINEFTKTYNKNNYLLTSRPYTNIELLTKFKNFDVCQLIPTEIEVFVRRQIPTSEKEIANKIIEAVSTDQNDSYISYLSNPLLLSMFILTYQTYSNVPPKKSSFYRQVFDSLFYLHDSVSKLSWARERKSGLNKEQFEYILKLFSFISFFREVFVFEETFINRLLDQIKEKKKSLNFDNQLLIEDLQVAICILNKEGMDYVFPHRSLQEYFASLYIISLDSANKIEAYKKILNQLIQNDFYQMFTKDNFYSLLTEQDHVGVIKHLTIPYLDKVNEEIKQNKFASKDDKNTSGLLYFLHSFHSGLEFTKELFKILREHNYSRHVLIKTAIERTKSSKIDLSKDEESKLHNLDVEIIKELKINLPKTIKSLKDYLREETLSDSSILDLI